MNSSRTFHILTARVVFASSCRHPNHVLSYHIFSAVLKRRATGRITWRQVAEPTIDQAMSCMSLMSLHACVFSRNQPCAVPGFPGQPPRQNNKRAVELEEWRRSPSASNGETLAAGRANRKRLAADPAPVLAATIDTHVPGNWVMSFRCGMQDPGMGGFIALSTG